MQRFTNDGRSGRRNAEEEVPPLGLSFGGGVAGARRYSRRQALGLLGGSLAGASLASLGLAAPAESQPLFLPFGNFDHISLHIVPQSTGQNTFLDGITQNCNVGLAPNTEPPFTGTRWEAVRVLGPGVPQNTFRFFCRANWPRPPGTPYFEPGCRWLDGRTGNGTVGLAPSKGFTGTRWEVTRYYEHNPDVSLKEVVALKCLGHLPGVRWLRGYPQRPPNGTVGLDGVKGAWGVNVLPK